MGQRGTPRRPDAIVAARRREVMLRMATGANLVEIAEALRTPYITIKRDVRWIRKHGKELQDPESDKVRTLVVGRLLSIDAAIVKRIELEHRLAKKGKTITKMGVPLVSGKKRPESITDVLAAATNELVPLEEITEILLPRIGGEAALLKLRIEIHRIILHAYGFGQVVKESHTKEVERIREGYFIMVPKLEEAKWVDAAKAYTEGQIPRVITEEETRGES